MDSAKITVIIPAYNVEKYLRKAVASIQAQTFSNWKMIIVDDCSSDSTLKIAQELASSDSRIKVMKMMYQSGGAYIPRKNAIMAASTPFVSPLDADDTVPPDYLQHLMDVIEREKPDAAYPLMYTLRDGKLEYTSPPQKSFIGKTFPGKEMVNATLDGWRIHCNGGIIKREIYLKAFRMIDEKKIEVKSYLDEYLTRILLYNCEKVAITNEQYIFRENVDSITHSKNIKAFGIIGNNLRLLSFIEQNYPPQSDTVYRAHRQNFHGIADAMRLLNKIPLSPKERKSIITQLKKCRSLINYNLLDGRVSIRYKMLISLPFRISLPLLRLIDSIHSPKRRRSDKRE